MRLSIARVLMVVQAVALAALLGTSCVLLVALAPALIGLESTVLSGDLAVVGPTPADTLAAGDLVVFRAPEAPDAIEYRRIESLEVGTAGQIQLHTAQDQLSVGPKVVLGRVQYMLPRVGALVTFAAQPLGRVVLLVLPSVLLAADSLRKRLATRSRGQRLLDAARRARAAGYVELAVTAARGVLQLDPENAEAQAIATWGTG
jgi:hypothetical protein